MQLSTDFPARCGTRLVGRRAECAVLDRLVGAVRSGEGRSLVVHGEPGAGKTALLDHLARQAADCRVVSVVGVQSEMELAFAGLHQLCVPMLDRVEALPAPQGDALRTAFGLCPGAAPDRFLLGVAVLGLLSEAAGEQPLICLVDDAQWLDQASAQVLAFVARRLVAEPVGVVFGVRPGCTELAGLPELAVGGLPEQDARALLDSVLTGPLDARVRDQIVAEAHGNPLALLEWPRALPVAELAGGFAMPGALPPSGSVEEGFRRQAEQLPVRTRLLLLLAAAEPTGDPALVWRAAGALGVGAEAAGPAVAADLIRLGARVRFRHPLVRSAAYRSASVPERREVHRALAEATDARLDPDRRAWHRAQAAEGPAEEIAVELERSAGRAQARGGQAAAAAFCERAALLTPDPADRARRALAAAQAMYGAGARDAALNLLALAEAGPQNELDAARVCLLRGQMAFASGRSADGPPLLLEAAGRFEAVDARLARETYLDALSVAMFVGRLADRVGMTEVAKAARSTPSAQRGTSASHLLLDGLAELIADGPAAGTPVVRRALRAFRDARLPCTRDEHLRWLFVAVRAAHEIWDDGAWQDLADRQVRLARDEGALSVLPLALSQRVFVHLHAGEQAAAGSLVAELTAIREATGHPLPSYGAMSLACWQGRGQDAARLVETAVEEATAHGEGIGLSLAHHSASVLYNGLGRFEEALASAERAAAYPEELGHSHWSLVELIEAAVRSGQPARAQAALERLTVSTGSAGTPWALGVEARCRALLCDGDGDDEAERRYRESIAHLSATSARAELARSHLLYGEWLRRQRRRADARVQLRTAHGMTEAMGMAAFAARARRELRATGETARKRAAATRPELTPQEAQIARLAREGLSNPEIGTRLFLSPRTVQYHLGKVFSKLDITSRGQLRGVLPAGPDEAADR
ncbi:AAA family ATPase [Streptomyces hokutonensis]|uniref:helix-turn-helix transcriptional regulator n=1 Tax=Streptomyces hokutonensis TaxID=1306990 RepID=UPI00381F718F